MAHPVWDYVNCLLMDLENQNDWVAYLHLKYELNNELLLYICLLYPQLTWKIKYYPTWENHFLILNFVIQTKGNPYKKRSFEQDRALIFVKHAKDCSMIFLSLRYILIYFENEMIAEKQNWVFSVYKHHSLDFKAWDWHIVNDNSALLCFS